MGYQKKGYADLTGKVFGCFTILALGPRKKGLRSWLAQCSCGAIHHRSTGDIQNGGNLFCKFCPEVTKRVISKEHQVTACGLTPKSFKDMTGKVFGNWTVMSRNTEARRQSQAFWNCVCSCGSQRAVDGSNLRKGLSTSCGGPAHIKQKAVRKLKTKKEKPPRKPIVRRQNNDIFDKLCKKCNNIIPVRVDKPLSGTKFALRQISDGRRFDRKICPECLKTPKVLLPRTASKKCKTPASWVRRSQQRRIEKVMKKYYPRISWSFSDFLGISAKELSLWIEKQFHPNPISGVPMTWADAGVLWELDHRIEIALFDKSNLKELKKAFHYTNVGPIWKPMHEEKTKRFQDSRKFSEKLTR